LTDTFARKPDISRAWFHANIEIVLTHCNLLVIAAVFLVISVFAGGFINITLLTLSCLASTSAASCKAEVLFVGYSCGLCIMACIIDLGVLVLLYRQLRASRPSLPTNAAAGQPLKVSLRRDYFTVKIWA
jgi:hypothetical protein